MESLKIDIPKYEYNVSTWVTLETKKVLYEIAFNEKRSVADVVRKFIEKGVSEYGR